MGYKVLGFVVWQGGKLYMRRHTSGFALKASLAIVGAAVIAGVLAAGKQHQSSN